MVPYFVQFDLIHLENSLLNPLSERVLSLYKGLVTNQFKWPAYLSLKKNSSLYCSTDKNNLYYKNNVYYVGVNASYYQVV